MKCLLVALIVLLVLVCSVVSAKRGFKPEDDSQSLPSLDDVSHYLQQQNQAKQPLQQEKHLIHLSQSEKEHIDHSFAKMKRSTPTVIHTLIFEVHRSRQQIKSLETLVHRIADIEDWDYYGRHLSDEQVRAMMENEVARDAIVAFLDGYNQERSSTTAADKSDSIAAASIAFKSLSYEFIEATAPISVWEEIFQTVFYDYYRSGNTDSSGASLDDDIYRRVDAYLLPPLLVNQVQAIYNLIDFPAQVNADLVIDRVQPKQTSANSLSTSNESHDEHVGIDKRLRIRSISHHSNQNESQDIHDHHRRLQTAPGFVTPSFLRTYYGMNPTSLYQGNIANYQAVYSTKNEYLSSNDLTTFQTRNRLPIQSVSNAASGLPTTNILANACQTTDCAEPNLDIQYLMGMSSNSSTLLNTWTGPDPWLQWIISVSSMTNIPFVISISYGSDEKSISSSYFHSFKLQALKLAARGTTIVASTGNTGANGGSCGYITQFPATVPYVLAVGATQGPESGGPEIACSAATGASITSGGGFSNKFKTPSWQTAAVNAYLASTSGAASVSGFNRLGRGYPDISLLAKSYEIIMNGSPVYVSGTSAATPVMAAMISLVNAQRLRAGKKTVGWINPLLYNTQVSSAFIRDITSGNNKCPKSTLCCNQGFSTSSGWDPVTGVGSISSYSAFYSTLVNLGNDMYSPTFLPSQSPALSRSPTIAVTRTPTAYTGGWLVTRIYRDSDSATGTCRSSNLVMLAMYPLERCIPRYLYNPDTGALTVTGYQKYSCGSTRASLTLYSDSTCRTLRSPTSTAIISYPSVNTCNTQGLEDTYYYNNDGYYSTSYTCNTGAADYRAFLPTVRGRSYSVRATFSDATCTTGTNKLTSYEVYRQGYCLNLPSVSFPRDGSPLPASSTQASNFHSFLYSLPSLSRFSDTQCSKQTGSYTSTTEQVANRNSCGYAASLLDGVSGIALSERWTTYTSP